MIGCRLVPESTRWLRMKGRLHEAMALFTKMARVNGREFKNKELQLSTQSHLKISKSTIADLFQPSSVAIYTIIQGAAWCVFSFSILNNCCISNDSFISDNGCIPERSCSVIINESI